MAVTYAELRKFVALALERYRAGFNGGERISLGGVVASVVGRVMRESQGRENPVLVRQAVLELLSEEHLRDPGHDSATCEVCKLARAGNAEERLGPTPAERQAMAEQLPEMTYQGEPFAALKPKEPKR